MLTTLTHVLTFASEDSMATNTAVGSAKVNILRDACRISHCWRVPILQRREIRVSIFVSQQVQLTIRSAFFFLRELDPGVSCLQLDQTRSSLPLTFCLASFVFKKGSDYLCSWRCSFRSAMQMPRHLISHVLLTPDGLLGHVSVVTCMQWWGPPVKTRVS